MSDLISDLLAAIEAREELARRTEPGRWAVWPSDMPGEFVVARRNERTGTQDPDRVATTHGLYCAEQNARFIADNDPSSVLRHCAADRELVALHPREGTDRRWECELCGPEGQNIDCTYPCDTLRLLARAYSVSVDTKEE